MPRPEFSAAKPSVFAAVYQFGKRFAAGVSAADGHRHSADVVILCHSSCRMRMIVVRSTYVKRTFVPLSRPAIFASPPEHLQRLRNEMNPERNNDAENNSRRE